ncbi:hypothetical protein C8Q75DRAFT_78094 [Abortiporus biennis]|nr:hypothetical protein C8Q75DRAFT_78094 [Abortiporus biennis]
MESESTTITTSETFNYPNADVIIRSSAPNKVDFRVHKFILSLSSSFFETMFTLPDLPKKAPKTNLPVVDVSEPADTIDPLLRIIYPSIPDPIFDTLVTLRPVLEAALKFEMQAAVVVLRRVLLKPAFLKVNPMKVYALAASYNFEDEAKVASQHTLNLELSTQPLMEDMKTMSAYYYHRLITMHRRRSEAARTLIQTFPPLTPSSHAMERDHPHRNALAGIFGTVGRLVQRWS